MHPKVSQREERTRKNPQSDWDSNPGPFVSLYACMFPGSQLEQSMVDLDEDIAVSQKVVCNVCPLTKVRPPHPAESSELL